MKKLIGLLLILALMMTMFAACSDMTNTEDEPEEVPPLAETVIYDENDIKITVTGMKDGWLGPELTVEIVNDSDANIALMTGEYIVNGVTVDGTGYVEAPAGEKVEEPVWIYQEALDMADIETVATIRCPDANIIDTDSYDTLYEIPFELTTSAGADYDQAIDDSGEVVFEAQGVTVISQIYTDDTYGRSMCLLVKNDSGNDIAMETLDTVINGTTVSAGSYDVVYADTVRFCQLDLIMAGLEEHGIDSIEQISFTLRLFDESTYDSIAQSDTITVTID